LSENAEIKKIKPPKIEVRGLEGSDLGHPQSPEGRGGVVWKKYPMAPKQNSLRPTPNKQPFVGISVLRYLEGSWEGIHESTVKAVHTDGWKTEEWRVVGRRGEHPQSGFGEKTS